MDETSLKPSDRRKPVKRKDFSIKALKPEDERYIAWIEGGQGLGVRVAPSGKKTFVYWYRHGDRKRLMTLGEYPAVSLARAEGLRDEASGVRKVAGEDPAELARRKKLAARAAGVRAAVAVQADHPTLRNVVDEMAENSEFLAKKSAVEVLRQIRKDILEFRLPGDALPLGDKPLDTVRKRDAVLVIDAVRKRGKRIGNAAASNFVRLGKFAAKRGLLDEERNPFRDFERARLPAKERALGIQADEQDDDRTWELVRTLERLPRVDLHPVTVLALLFVLVTGQRPGEVSAMPKAELKKDGTLWTIPAERYKTAWREASPKPHHVPLSTLAQELLKLAAIYNAGSPWVFPSPNDPERHLAQHTLPRAVLRKLGKPTPPDAEPAAGTLGVSPFTPHDLRRTCRSWLAALGVPDPVAEKVLGHKLAGILGVYNRHTYLDERADALQKWADQLEKLAPTLLPTLAAHAVDPKRRGVAVLKPQVATTTTRKHPARARKAA
jgi:integrase